MGKLRTRADKSDILVTAVSSVKLPIPEKVSSVRVRMFIPDYAPRNLPNFRFDYNSEEVIVEAGVAVVNKLIADELEEKGWIRGREIDSY